MKMTRKEGSVNVAAIARRICGIPSDKKVNDMTQQQKRDFWNVSKALAKPRFSPRGGKPKAITGYGMKLIEKFVMAH